jgi:hypothetical protein
MTLQSTNFYASFDVPDGAQIRDISALLAPALYMDLNLLGALNIDMGNQAEDTTHRWNEDALNTDTVTASGSVSSTGTTVTASTGQGARVHVGDLLYATKSGSTEVMQVTAVSTDAVTVVRAYNSTTAAVIADGDVLGIIRAEQEGSDIGIDRSVSPTVRLNYHHILSAFDLLVTGNQLARKMATNALQDWVAHQLANRAIEMKINLTRALLYSEVSASAGSDTVYSTMGGLRYWLRTNSAANNVATGTFSMAQVNSTNTKLVKLGVYADTLLIGPDLVSGTNGVASFDATLRRLVESDRQVGYMVQEVLLNQGNSVRVVVDGRVNTGDAFLLVRDNFIPMPVNGRGMFTIAAVDFTDGKKRRVLGDWTNEFRHPEAAGAYFTGQS